MRTIRTASTRIAALGGAVLLAFSLAGCSSSPSKEEMKQGLEKMLTDMGQGRQAFKDLGMTDEQIDSYFTCITDKSYDTVSNDGKQALAKGDPETKISKKDEKAFTDAVNECSSQIK